MNKIEQAFSKGKAFIPYITAGDPDLATTEKIIYALDNAGADLIELGIPFSDPVAEGPVIEAASERALKTGVTVDMLFDMVERVAPNINAVLLFMTYYNPVFVYGNDKFAAKCKQVGIHGLIVPDLPFEEREELLEPCNRHGIELISLIAPTSQGRIARIAEGSGGFLYCVSSLGTTGERATLSENAAQMIRMAKQAKNIPCAVGFGISNAAQAQETATFADGVIVGSAIVKIIAEHGKDSVPFVEDFAAGIKNLLLLV